MTSIYNLYPYNLAKFEKLNYLVTVSPGVLIRIKLGRW